MCESAVGARSVEGQASVSMDGSVGSARSVLPLGLAAMLKSISKGAAATRGLWLASTANWLAQDEVYKW